MSSPRDPVVGSFVLPDARLSSKQKAPRGKETRPSSLFYGKGGTKFPNTVNETLRARLFDFVVGSALGQSPAKIQITTWNLERFPNGSSHEATPKKQAQRIEAAADVLKKLDPDILLLQEMRDYDA
jgi:hypothetical protein